MLSCIRFASIFIFMLITYAEVAEANYEKRGFKGAAAAPAVERYLADTKIDCTTLKGDGRCSIAETTHEVSLFQGKIEGRSGASAVAFITYSSDMTGNAEELMAVVFDETNGQYTVLGRAENLRGGQPLSVTFGRGIITYVGSAMRPFDPRCCPTGKATFHLAVSQNGVAFMKPK